MTEHPNPLIRFDVAVSIQVDMPETCDVELDEEPDSSGEWLTTMPDGSVANRLPYGDDIYYLAKSDPDLAQEKLLHPENFDERQTPVSRYYCKWARMYNGDQPSVAGSSPSGAEPPLTAEEHERVLAWLGRRIPRNQWPWVRGPGTPGPMVVDLPFEGTSPPPHGPYEHVDAPPRAARDEAPHAVGPRPRHGDSDGADSSSPKRAKT